MDTVAMWGKSGRLSKRTMSWLTGVLVLIALSGCSGTAMEAQANYRTVVAQATATASGRTYQSQSLATSVSDQISAEATKIKQGYEYAGKQAEDQALTTILLGLVILGTISGLTTLGVRLYGRRLKYKTALEEQFIYSVQQQQLNRRR